MTSLTIKKVLFVLALTVGLTENQQFDNYCRSIDVNLLCENFTSFAQLNLSYFEPQINATSFKYLVFAPSEPLLLDATLNVDKLPVATDTYEVTLNNILGIDILSNPFAEIDPGIRNIFQLDDSKFELIYENEPVDSLACNYILQNEIFIPLTATASLFFLNNPTFSSTPTCQAFFNTANLNLFDISNVNFENNSFSFHSNSNFTSDFSSNIQNFNIRSSDFVLGENILDKHVFKTLQYFSIQNSSLRSIQDDTFAYFSFLKFVQLELSNFGSFFRSSSNEWLTNLNANVSVNLTDADDVRNNLDKKLELFLIDPSNTYDYPSSDICSFRMFPHEKLIMPIIQTKTELECTCTLLWLLKYKSIYDSNSKANPMYTESTSKCLDDPNFSILLQNCDFDANFERCDPNYTTSSPANNQDFRTATIILSTLSVILVGIIAYVLYVLRAKKKPSFYENVDEPSINNQA